MNYVKISTSNKIIRGMFNLTWLIFCRWTPRHFNFLRILVLRAFGAELGSNVNVYNSVKIWFPANLTVGNNSCLAPGVKIYNVSEVKIGSNTIISQETEICTPSHDFNSKGFELISAPITIGSYCWLASGAFVGPNSKIADGVVLGAKCVTSGKNLSIGVYSGNPGQKIKDKKCIQYLF